jgi:7-cyano-7-deazaguanine synthase in queuosine biosynthesis
MGNVTPKELPRIDVVVAEKRKRSDARVCCVIGEHIQFNEDKLLSYCFAEWKPVVFDMLVVAAAVEFCDRLKNRPAIGWGRDIYLEIPVHDKALWESQNVKASLISALSFLTGDKWNIVFVNRKAAETSRTQASLALPSGAKAIVSIIRVRLGSKRHDQPKVDGRLQPFTNVPYKVKSSERRFSESSNRSRGFKFSMIAGIAAYLADVDTVIVPESGQGALGPALIPVVQAYPDYRNHPRFTERMEKFLAELLGHHVSYVFPRLWYTKGETLKAFVANSDVSIKWDETISCWQQNRHVSVDGHRRQCGICAACMLRRMSVHAAGLAEPENHYVWENLRAANFEDGVPKSFTKITSALREYAIAGTMHMDHLAGLADTPRHQSTIRRNASQLAKSLDMTNEDAEMKLVSLLRRHRDEWRAFVGSLGPNSFICQWAVNAL